MTKLPGATRFQMAGEVHPPEKHGSGTLRVHDQLLLGRRILREKFGHSRPRLLRAGELLGSANEASASIYHLRSGWACQFRDWFDGRRAIVDVYLPGDVIGVGARLGVRPLEQALVLTSIMVEEIPTGPALEEVMADRATALYLAWLLSKHQRRADRLLAAVSGLDARGRLAMMLLDFYRRLQRRKLITGPTYNRVLRSLRTDRIVSLEKHWVTILDLQLLTNLTRYGQRCEPVGRDRESPLTDRQRGIPPSSIGRALDRRSSIQDPRWG